MERFLGKENNFLEKLVKKYFSTNLMFFLTIPIEASMPHCQTITPKPICHPSPNCNDHQTAAKGLSSIKSIRFPNNSFRSTESQISKSFHITAVAIRSQSVAKVVIHAFQVESASQQAWLVFRTSRRFQTSTRPASTGILKFDTNATKFM